MKILLRFFPLLLPLATRWATVAESRILVEGVPLTEIEMPIARQMGVAFPEKIRLMKVDFIPLPKNLLLRKAALATGFMSPHTSGMSLRYGIFIRKDCWGDIDLIAHECVHTAQYERMGGIDAFLKQYLRECLEIGYPEAPMEQEAVLTALRRHRENPH